MSARETMHPRLNGRFCLSWTALLIAGFCGGCGSSTTAPSITSRPTVTAGAHRHVIVARDIGSLARLGYSVDTTLTSSLPDGSTMYVFHSICTGSADGHCQAVDAFRGDAKKSIWHRQYIGVHGIHAVPNGFSVIASSYTKQDPLCCPSLPDVTDTYTWNGSGFTERGPLPRSPAS